MPSTDTPLRYPGGKTQLADFVGSLLAHNSLQGGHYAEPFAGGAGIAWRLLFSGQASEIWLNDVDPAVFAFWSAAVHETAALCELVNNAVLDVDEWKRQRAVFKNSASTTLERGFATLYLNRTNRSGILHAGVIGGLSQDGKYKLDCRFNKGELSRKIERIGRYREVVHISNDDARICLEKWERYLPARSLLNIDPPYFAKGSELYLNHFKVEDHASLSRQVRKLKRRWIMTYDDTPEIEALYQACPMYRTNLLYSAQIKRQGAELLITHSKIEIPLFAKRRDQFVANDQSLEVTAEI